MQNVHRKDRGVRPHDLQVQLLVLLCLPSKMVGLALLRLRPSNSTDRRFILLEKIFAWLFHHHLLSYSASPLSGILGACSRFGFIRWSFRRASYVFQQILMHTKYLLLFVLPCLYGPGFNNRCLGGIYLWILFPWSRDYNGLSNSKAAMVQLLKT